MPARQEREQEGAQESRSLPSPNNSGACDSNPGPSLSVRTQSFLKAREHAGAKCGLAHLSPCHPRPGAASGGWLDLCRVSPTRGIRAPSQEKAQEFACRLGEEPLSPGFTWVGGDERVEGGRLARLPAERVQRWGGDRPSTPAGQEGLTWTCPCTPRIWERTPPTLSGP